MISAMLYLLLNVLTYVFTTIMAIAGVGAAFIVIPMVYYAGYDFLEATAIGLLLNTISTGSASIRHYQNNAIDFMIALPIVISSILFTPVGAYFSEHVSRHILRLLFAFFLLFVGINILYKTYKMYLKERSNQGLNENGVSLGEESEQKKISTITRITISIIIGSIVGLIAGLIGVGGGSLILPFLLYLGLETKKAAGTTSFIVVFSSFLGFLSKIAVTSIHLDLLLIFTLSISTILAAITGSYLMHYKLNKHQIKGVMGIMLLLVSLKIFSEFL